MYICSECESILSEDELDYISDNTGECWGYTAYHRHRCCPFCKGDIEPFKDCERG